VADRRLSLEELELSSRQIMEQEFHTFSAHLFAGLPWFACVRVYPAHRYFGNHFLMMTLYSCIASGTVSRTCI
jgi:hypothetical protein